MPDRVIDEDEPFAPVTPQGPAPREDRQVYQQRPPGLPDHPSSLNDPAEIDRVGKLADHLWPGQDWPYHMQTFARRFWVCDIEVAINQAYGAKAERPYSYINSMLSRWYGETKGKPKHGPGANPGTVRVLKPGDKGPEQVAAEREIAARTLEHHKRERRLHEARVVVEAEARARWDAMPAEEQDRIREDVKARFPDVAPLARMVERLCLAEIEPRLRDLG